MSRLHRRGFTLLELMIVVSIVGLLAAIALPAFHHQIQRSRMSDAFHGLTDIRRAQATYFAHFSQYCPAPWNPATVPGATLTGFDDTDPAWRIMGFRPNGPQRFQYRVVTGAPGVPPPRGVVIPTDDFWFVAQANGDLDGDGQTAFVETYSMSTGYYLGRGIDGPPLDQGWE